MAPSYLVIDIETVPDASLWRAPPDAPDAFPPVHVHRPICIGILWLDEAYRFRRIGVIGDGKGDGEPAMLEEFSEFVGTHQPDLVTYNGRAFDLPVLTLRALRHGVPMPWYYQGKLRDRYSQEGHVDLCDMLCDHGAARSMSLDAVAQLIGLPGKIGMDGSQVEGMYKAGQLEAIKSYCLADVAQTALLFLRFRLLQGAIDAVSYRRIAAELMDALRADPRLDAVVRAVDGHRLLLAAAA